MHDILTGLEEKQELSIREFLLSPSIEDVKWSYHQRQSVSQKPVIDEQTEVQLELEFEKPNQMQLNLLEQFYPQD